MGYIMIQGNKLFRALPAQPAAFRYIRLFLCGQVGFNNERISSKVRQYGLDY